VDEVFGVRTLTKPWFVLDQRFPDDEKSIVQRTRPLRVGTRKEKEMIIRSLSEIEGTERDVNGAMGTWRSKRLVLANDNAGFSLHETTVYAGTETHLWYKNHVEAVLCVEGECKLTNEESGEVHIIRPGDMYLLDRHERHTLRPRTLFRAICVFNPAVTGREDHDEDGSYPAPPDAA
jgi:L-ectoine synthase